jgi:hypothetical protein
MRDDLKDSLMPTLARDTFNANCSDVDRLLGIHADIAGDAPGRKYGVEVLNKSAVVLICAFWEAYVEDVVSEALDFIVGNTTDVTKLPVDLRKVVAKSIRQDPHDLSPWTLAGDGWKTVLRTNLAAAKVKYLTNWNTPKSGNIRELFTQSLGLPDLPSKWQRPWLTSANALKKLDEFVTLRGAIAHRGRAAKSVTKAQAEGFLWHVRKELVIFTDDAVNAHAKSVTGASLF